MLVVPEGTLNYAMASEEKCDAMKKEDNKLQFCLT